MKVTIFSQESILARMLELEAKRCELSLSTPEDAQVWLMDLDHLPPLPRREAPALRIGFTTQPQQATGLSLDAVLPIPFPAHVLEALLRQREGASASALRREGDVLWLSGKKLHFSRIERQILSLLLQGDHRVVTVQELAAIIGRGAENSNAVAVYLYRLRRKLEADGITRIRTVRGVGYQWMGE